jgi:hypothetical protein
MYEARTVLSLSVQRCEQTSACAMQQRWTAVRLAENCESLGVLWATSFTTSSSTTLRSRDTLLYDAVPWPIALSGQPFDNDRSDQLPACWFYLTTGKTASNKLVDARLDRRIVREQ